VGEGWRRGGGNERAISGWKKKVRETVVDRTDSSRLGRDLGGKVEMQIPVVLRPNPSVPFLLSSKGCSTPAQALTTQVSVGASTTKSDRKRVLEAMIFIFKNREESESS
jgi:hypothetical protein